MIARYSRLKLLGWLAASAVPPVAGFWVILEGLSDPVVTRGSAMLIALFAAPRVLLFLPVFSVILMKLFDRSDQVRIDENGLRIRGHSCETIALRALTGPLRREGRVIFGLARAGKYPIETRWRRFIQKANGADTWSFFGDAWIFRR